MNNNNEKKINWLKTVRPLALILVLVFLLTCATYAWMKRDWSRSVKQDNIKIQAASSLKFIFAGEDYNEVPINELIGQKDFEFRSVSNCTGNKNDFFGLNFGSIGKGDDEFFKLTAPTEDEDTSFAAKNGYLVLNFTVAVDFNEGGTASDVFIDAASYIRATSTDGEGNSYNERAAKAVRISVTVDGEEPKVFANNDQVQESEFTSEEIQEGTIDYSLDAITNVQKDGIYMADGVERYEEFEGTYIEKENIDLTTPLKVESILSVLGGSEIKVCTLDEENPEKNITVCIWLEGEDPRCEDYIAGSALDLLLKFSAKPITKG